MEHLLRERPDAETGGKHELSGDDEGRHIGDLWGKLHGRVIADLQPAQLLIGLLRVRHPATSFPTI